MEGNSSAPAASAPDTGSAPTASPMNNETWQWAVIIGTIVFFAINAWTQYHQTKLNRMQIAELEKQYKQAA